MNLKFNYYWFLFLIPLGLVCWFFVAEKQNKPVRYLSYYGPKHNPEASDTSYHTVPGFEFISQYNEKVSQATFENKIYVTEYFFTTCQSICPVMNSNMEKVYKAFANDSDVLILSHTVDPETDSVPVLFDYAKQHGVNNKKWLFVTGDKKKLYAMARKGYLLNAEEGNGGDEDFIHTQNFALVDREKHIRGFYDGTDSLEIKRLIGEIKLLLNEYDYKAHTAN